MTISQRTMTSCLPGADSGGSQGSAQKTRADSASEGCGQEADVSILTAFSEIMGNNESPLVTLRAVARSSGTDSVRATLRRSGSALVSAASRVSGLASVSAVLSSSARTPEVSAVPRRLAWLLVRATSSRSGSA